MPAKYLNDDPTRSAAHLRVPYTAEVYEVTRVRVVSVRQASRVIHFDQRLVIAPERQVRTHHRIRSLENTIKCNVSTTREEQTCAQNAILFNSIGMNDEEFMSIPRYAPRTVKQHPIHQGRTSRKIIESAGCVGLDGPRST